MQRYGLIGKGISQSLSPVIQNAAFQDCGISATYELFDLDEIDLPAMVELLRQLNGVNITAPYKERILTLMDELDPVAEKIGAINTVRNDDGRFLGYNTDWIGVLSPLRQRMSLEGKSCVVLGAGGAARAAVFALVAAGARVTVCNRTRSHAERLARDFGCELGEVNELPSADILIQATSVNSPAIVPKQLERFGTVFDLVYKPLMTPLLEKAQALGCEMILGIEMLVHQGAAAFEIWTGQEPNVALMMDRALASAGGHP